MVVAADTCFDNRLPSIFACVLRLSLSLSVCGCAVLIALAACCVFVPTSLRADYEKLAQEKAEMHRHYIMVSDPFALARYSLGDMFFCALCDSYLSRAPLFSSSWQVCLRAVSRCPSLLAVPNPACICAQFRWHCANIQCSLPLPFMRTLARAGGAFLHPRVPPLPAWRKKTDFFSVPSCGCCLNAQLRIGVVFRPWHACRVLEYPLSTKGVLEFFSRHRFVRTRNTVGCIS